MRVKCDSSRSGLGAALEQLTVDWWKLIAITSRFPNSCKERYRVNELEVLGVFLSVLKTNRTANNLKLLQIPVPSFQS